MTGQKLERATCFAALPGNRYVVAGLEVFDGREEKVWSYLSGWDVQTGKHVTLVDLKIAWPARHVPLGGGSTLLQDFRPTSLAGLADGQRVAVGDSGGRVHLFDVLTGKLLRSFDSLPRNPVSMTRPIAASPDGRYLASHCEGTILIWDLRTGKR
jgi:WD40 repeat protein